MSPRWSARDWKDSPVIPSLPIESDPSLHGGVTIGGNSQTLRCAQGDIVRLMRIGADKSAMGAINRPLRLVQAGLDIWLGKDLIGTMLDLRELFNVSGLTAVITGIVVPVDGGFSSFSGV